MFWTLFLLSSLFSFSMNEHSSVASLQPDVVTSQTFDSIVQPRFICDRMADSLELVKFYNALDGPNWINKWDLNEPINTWYGITLNIDGCVSKINLEQNNLIGELINFNFPFLETLSLMEAQYTDGTKFITGEIPDFSLLPNLQNLRLWGSFTGSIPNFSNVDSLKYLEITGYFTGNIPDFSKISRLEELLITGVFNGNIPDFQYLPNLKSLNIYGQFEGTIIFNGNEIGAPLSNLSGPIPNFSNLDKLQVLQLGRLSCTGSVPNFDKLPNLIALQITHCLRLVNPLPKFNKMNKLNSLYIFSCNFMGEIPEFELPNLKEIIVSNTLFDGSPPVFSGTPQMLSINLHNNHLDSSVPKYTNLLHLRELQLRENEFTFEDLVESTDFNDSLINSNKIYYFDSLYYNIQDTIFHDTMITIPENTLFNIDLGIDELVFSNVYSWFKNGVPFDTIFGLNKLIFNSIQAQDAGTYTVQITNPNAPDLTLYSYPIEIQVIPCSSPTALNDNIELDENTLSANIDLLGNDTLPNDPGNYQVELLTVPTNFIISNTGSHTFLVSVGHDSSSFNEILKYLVCDTTCENACDTGSLNVIWTAPEPDQQKPILLTPNGDNVNDILVIEGIEEFPNNELLIVNRWGDVVYKAKPYMNNWGGEGTDGSLLTQGTYYFILRNVGAQLPQSGDIVILK